MPAGEHGLFQANPPQPPRRVPVPGSPRLASAIVDGEGCVFSRAEALPHMRPGGPGTAVAAVHGGSGAHVRARDRAGWPVVTHVPHLAASDVYQAGWGRGSRNRSTSASTA